MGIVGSGSSGLLSYALIKSRHALLVLAFIGRISRQAALVVAFIGRIEIARAV